MKQRMVKWHVVMLTAGLVGLMMFAGVGIFFDAAPKTAVAGALDNPPRYIVTDLGRIVPQAINNRGQVVGYDHDNFGPGPPILGRGAILWDSGEIIILGSAADFPEPDYSNYYTFESATDINDAGQVVGVAINPASEMDEAFLWQDGEIQWLGILEGNRRSTAQGINNLGHAIGFSSSFAPSRAFRWQNGVMSALGTLGGTQSYANAINDQGQIVGDSLLGGGSSFRAFVWQNGGMSALVVADHNRSHATDINNLGQVIGGIDGSQFLWLPEPAYGLPAGLNILDLPDQHHASINNLGQVVTGRYLWQNGVTTDISDLFPTDSGWSLVGGYQVSRDINDRGQIVGLANYNGERRGFLLTPPVTPLILVPGIAASQLVDTANGTERWPGLFSSQSPLSLLPEDAPFPNLIAPDVMRKVKLPLISDEHVYDLLLDDLTTTGGYVEYEVDGNPARRTTAGCDVASQVANYPNLFIFAYDWRLDNVANAVALKDYVGCVQQFYPDTPVNILAHSMGGLLSRRYILDNPNDHDVNALITIGSPFLGAPKMIYVLESGDFVPFVSNDAVKTIVASFTAAHQLLPGEPYSILAGNSPLVEAGWDLNDNGEAEEGYTYVDYIDVIDDRYAHPPFLPGTTAHTFHAYTTAQGGQGDWSNDDTGVQYYHIVGRQPEDKTIGQVAAALKTTCVPSPFGLTCLTKEAFKLSFTAGDGTVPVLSAERRGNGLDFNAPDAQVHIITNTNEKLVEHTGLTHNPQVWELVHDLLANVNSLEPATSRGRPVAHAATLAPPTEQAYYLTIIGGELVVVEDSLGNSTAPIPDTLNGLGTVPGVDRYHLGEGMHMLVMSSGQPYTVTFPAEEGVVAVELLIGSGQNISQAVRYQDVSLPAGAAVQLTLDALGYEAMRYDSNGDGHFETVVTPTVSVTGSQAQDVEAPVISFTVEEQADGWQVSLAAVDEGSGVKDLYYSLDGMDFQFYTAPFAVTRQTPIIHVFADDNVGNRATQIITLVASQVESHRLHLPVIVR